MSLLAQYRSHARYNQWMNEKLYASAALLDERARTANRGAFFGSIHGTLNHLVLGDRVWMLRFTGDQQRYVSRDSDGNVIEVRALSDVLYRDFEELRRERARTDADIVEWIDGLSADDLDRTIEYRTSGGAIQRHVAWWAIGHLFNHQTHHRGQVTTLLYQAGIDPGVTDLIAYLREAAL